MTRKSAQFLPGPDSEAVEAQFEVDFDESETEKTAHDEALESFIAALNSVEGDARLMVKRQTVDGRSTMEHIGSFPVDKFTFYELIDYLRDNYGGGDYRLQIVGKKGLIANRLVSIAQPKNPTVQRHSQGGEFNSMLGQILSTIERQQQQITDLARTNTGGSKKEMLEELQMMKEIIGGSSKNSANTFEQLRDVVGIFKELGVGAEREEGFGQFLPLIEKLIDNGDRSPPSPHQPTLQHNPQPRPQQRQEHDAMQFMIKMGLAQLVKAAQIKSDPGAYAQMVVDQLPEQKIKEFFTQDNSLEQIYKWEPRLKGHEEWVSELAEHVKALVGMESAVANEYLTPDAERDKKADSLGASVEDPTEMAPKLNESKSESTT